MKSGKQRCLEIKEKRRKKIKANAHIDVYADISKIPKDGIKADHTQLTHNTSWSLPLFYVDKEFNCVDCGSHEIWTAKQQKMVVRNSKRAY